MTRSLMMYPPEDSQSKGSCELTKLIEDDECGATGSALFPRAECISYLFRYCSSGDCSENILKPPVNILDCG